MTSLSIPFNQPARYVLSGITRNSTGTALADCNVEAYEVVSGLLRGATVSNSLGEYLIHVTGGEGLVFFVVAYKAGAPDVAGTSLNTLVGVEGV
jgi:hypothetical protein